MKNNKMQYRTHHVTDSDPLSDKLKVKHYSIKQVHNLPYSKTHKLTESNRDKLMRWHKKNVLKSDTKKVLTASIRNVSKSDTNAATLSDTPKKSKSDEIELNSKAVIAAKVLARREASLLLVRKYRILEFWKENPKYAIVRPALRKKSMLERRILWQKLTDILNSYDGQKRTRKEWLTIWNAAKSHVKKKISRRMQLTDFEAELAKFIFKCKVKGRADTDTDTVSAATQPQKYKDASETKTKRLDRDSDFSKSNCDNQDDENKSGHESDESECFTNRKASYEQKLNLLAYWKHHHMISGSYALCDTKQKRRLWQEATAILNNCKGPKRSWREWSDLWSSWKNNVKRNVVSQRKMKKHLNIKLAEHILETDHLTLRDSPVDLKRTCNPTAKLANNTQMAHEPIIQIITDDESDYCRDDTHMQTESKLKHDEESQQDDDAAACTYNDNSNEPRNADFNQNLLDVHQQNLDFQEEILDQRKKLVRSIEEGFHEVVGIFEEMREEKFSNLKNKISKRSQMTPFQNVSPINNISKYFKESEFDSFGRNVVMQLEQLPPQIASETRQLILQALEDSVEVMSELEDVYILQVMDEELESDVS